MALSKNPNLKSTRVRNIAFGVIVVAPLFCQLVGAEEVEVAVRTPVCVFADKLCNYDITLFDAQKQALVGKQSVLKCRAEQKQQRDKKDRQQRSVRPNYEKKVAKAKTRRPKRLPVKPIPSPSFEINEMVSLPSCKFEARTYSAPGCESGAGDAFGEWAEVENISDGRQALADLLERAKTGITFGDGGNEWGPSIPGFHSPLVGERRFKIVEVISSLSNEQHLALCIVRRVGDVFGPPSYCTTVAILTPTKTLLRVELDSLSNRQCLAGASSRLGGTIDIDFEIDTSLAIDKFSSSFSRLLKEELGFYIDQKVFKSETGTIASIEFRSTSGLRESPILQGGWREALDLDLSIRIVDAGRISVWAAVNPKVVRTAAGALTEYHGPDDAQKTAYAAFLNGHVNTAITRVCQTFTQTDDKNIVCR